jgi:hypothetical protein
MQRVPVPEGRSKSRSLFLHSVSRALRNDKNPDSQAQQGKSSDVMRGGQTIKSEQPRDNDGVSILKRRVSRLTNGEDTSTANQRRRPAERESAAQVSRMRH